MQETEVTKDININELSTSKYCLELENNTVKSRVGFYIAEDLNYLCRNDLEGIDSNIIIIDLVGESKLRVINIYRSFAPQGGESQLSKFEYKFSVSAEGNMHAQKQTKQIKQKN